MRAHGEALTRTRVLLTLRGIFAVGALVASSLGLCAEANQPCLVCHNSDGAPHLQWIFDTGHGELACVDCHGAPGNHTRNPALEFPAVTFGPNQVASVEARTNVCLSCHQEGLEHWRGSPHDAEEMTCTACHAGHVAADPVLAAATQADTCSGCHEAAEHPIELDTSTGPSVCTTCHAPHGTGQARMLALPTGARVQNETCLTCHNPHSSPAVQGIFATAHVEQTCVSCHGNPGDHSRNPSNVKPAVTFGPNFFASEQVQKAACLDCHEDELEHWAGSPHDNDDMTCSACHGGHAPTQPVADVATQAEVCAGCHERADHPITLEPADGPVVCVTCHQPHGTGKDTLLALPTGDDVGDDTCLTCHNPESSPAVHGIFATAHAEQTCVSCHGNPGNHSRSPGNFKPAVTFGPNFFASAGEQKDACLSCHEDELEHWAGSPHDNDDMTCSACHGGHSSKLAAFGPLDQAGTCGSCHDDAHPGQFDMAGAPPVCTNCHDSHGSSQAHALAFTAEALADDQTCLTCHNPTRSSAVQGIFASPHWVADDPRTPRARDGCLSCHGDPGNHPLDPSGQPPAVTFGPNHNVSADVQNEVCLGCHRRDAAHWDGGTHAVEDLVCSDCHDTHVGRQPVLARSTQAQACYDCHQDVRAEVRLPSRHPILEGKVVCTDCHEPHGSLKPGELVGINLNDTCLGCHEDQRGPFLFEHPPATEDCASCHVPHGAVHEPLLMTRGPFLCQECHVANFHPSDLNSGAGLPGGQPNGSLLGRNCMNCHAKVHGSNHPSGARLNR